MIIDTKVFPEIIESIRKDLSDLHDKVYDIADKLIKEHNPCNIHKLDNGKIGCTNHPDGDYNNMLCCSDCRTTTEEGYWDNGCTVECLGCKLYLCSAARRNNRELSDKLYNLQRTVEKAGMRSTEYYMPKNKLIDYCTEHKGSLR
jgi:hypothetical protein